MLDRYCSALLTTGEARWTPPTAHDETVSNLEHNIPSIARSGLMNRLTVTDRSGTILYDGNDPADFVRSWRNRFNAPLDETERTVVSHVLSQAERCAPLMSPDDYDRLESELHRIDDELLHKTLSAQGPLLPVIRGKWKQNRNRDGSYTTGGHWE